MNGSMVPDVPNLPWVSKSRKPNKKIGNIKKFQKVVLGIVAKKIHGKFQAERMNGSMVSYVPKFAWVSKISFKSWISKVQSLIKKFVI